jgi:uncharacterized protein YjiK
MRISKKSLVPMAAKAAAIGLLLAGSAASMAAVTSIDLGGYRLSATYALPAITTAEASAITYNWDTGTLFVVGDEGTALVEVSNTGMQLSLMALFGFDDTEGLTYVGNGQFVITEERQRDAYLLTYGAGGSATRASLPGVDLGTTIGNSGIEGISYDPRDGSFVTVKEIFPQEVNAHQIDFDAGTATSVSIFTPNLGVIDLSDVQLLATVASLAGSSAADNLLILSQESSRLLEVDRLGNILSEFDLSGLADSIEGVTITPDRTIYLVAENGSNPLMYELQPVPLPAAVWLFGSGLVGLIGLRRKMPAR